MLPAWFYEDRHRGKQQARAIVREREPKTISVETWLGGYCYILPDNRSDETAYNDAKMVRAFRRKFGDRRVSSITVLEAQAWYLKHPSHRKFLRRAWRLAVQMQVAELDIWQILVAPPRKKPKPRAPTPSELAVALANCQLRDAAASHSFWAGFADFIIVAAHVGARRGGMVAIGRKDVEIDERRLTLKEKGGKTRRVLLAGPALEAMQRQFERRNREGWRQENRGHGYKACVWITSTGRPLTGDTVKESWSSVRDEFAYGIHSLRHYASNWLAEAGVDQLDIAVQLGHVDEHGRPYRELVEQVYTEPDHELAIKRIEVRLDNPPIGGAA